MNKIQVETYARHQIVTRLKDLGWKMRETDGFEVVVQKEEGLIEAMRRRISEKTNRNIPLSYSRRDLLIQRCVRKGSAERP